MEVQYFLEERTAFIRHFYETASKPFCDILEQIRTESPPFDHPRYDESGDQPFLEEYGDAADGLNMLGRTAISMLKQVMHDYFNEWEVRIKAAPTPETTAAFKTGGLFNGYRHLFENALGCHWTDSEANLELLEQVVLARNAEQHETNITSRHANHSKKDIERFGDKLRFVSDMERKYREQKKRGEEGFDDTSLFWLGHIEVTKEDILDATRELEKLAGFLEPRFNKFYHGTETGFPIKV